MVPQCADDHLVRHDCDAARRVGVARQRLERGDEGRRRKNVEDVASSPGLRNARSSRRGGLASRHAREASIQRHHARVRAAKQGRRFGRSLFLPPSLDDVGVHRVAATRRSRRSATSSCQSSADGASSPTTTPRDASARRAVAIARVSIRTGHGFGPPGRASRRGGRRGPVRSFCGRRAVENTGRRVKARLRTASLWDSERLSSVSGARGGRCGWCSARWAPSVRAATVVAGTAVGYGTMLGSTPAPCSCGSPERRESSSPRRPHRNHALVREATRREAYDRLAESFDEEIEWHELGRAASSLCGGGCCASSRVTCWKSPRGACLARAATPKRKKSRTSSVFRVALRPSSPRSRPLVRASDLSPPRTLSFPNQDRPQLGVLPPRRAAHRDGLFRADGGGVPAKAEKAEYVAPAARSSVRKKTLQRRTARRARRLRETSRTAVFMIVRP